MLTLQWAADHAVPSRDGGSGGTTYALGLAGDTWHTIRIDVDNTANTYDLTLNGSPLDSGLGFRTGNGDAEAALISFAVFGNNNLSPANPFLLDAVVPEPSTYAFLIGLIALGAIVVRRSRIRK